MSGDESKTAIDKITPNKTERKRKAKSPAENENFRRKFGADTEENMAASQELQDLRKVIEQIQKDQKEMKQSLESKLDSFNTSFVKGMKEEFKTIKDELQTFKDGIYTDMTKLSDRVEKVEIDLTSLAKTNNPEFPYLIGIFGLILGNIFFATSISFFNPLSANS